MTNNQFITKKELLDSLRKTKGLNELFKISEKKIMNYVNKNYDKLKKKFLAKQKVNIKKGGKQTRRKKRRKNKTRKKQRGGFVALLAAAFCIYVGGELFRACSRSYDDEGTGAYDARLESAERELQEAVSRPNLYERTYRRSASEGVRRALGSHLRDARQSLREAAAESDGDDDPVEVVGEQSLDDRLAAGAAGAINLADSSEGDYDSAGATVGDGYGSDASVLSYE